MVYKMGDNYMAARSNEFGYANYEVEAVELIDKEFKTEGKSSVHI